MGAEVRKFRVKPKGMGDVIANITFVMGVSVLAENTAKLLGEDDCGCEERRKKLNEMMPFKK